MTISSTSPTPSYPVDKAKVQPKKTTPEPAQAAPSAPMDRDGDNDGSTLNTYA